MKEKLAVFDIDGTLFRNSLLIELHWKLIKEGIFPQLVQKQIDEYYWAWVNREGHYDDYINQVIKTFLDNITGVSEEKISQIAKQVVRAQSKIVYRYTRDLIEDLRGEYFLLAISGSPELMVKEFTEQWDFDDYIGTSYEVKQGKYTGKVLSVASDKKQEILENFISKNAINKESSVGVGDTDSDVGIFNVVNRPICFNPNQALYDIAKVKGWEIVVERKDVIYKM